MVLTPGTRIGVYEITARLGEGGMGQVYRATDTKLKREVAIKILPPLLADDADRLARFQREAEVLASLNHPNIAGIHGIEESDGARALVLELVEGDDLSRRIARGAIPLDEALPIARQIAEALEAAHEQGIIHRDLKPANIKVRPDGTVKVLDFGLAKAMEPDGAMSESMSMSPTITTPAMTQVGMMLGTAAYMSPEQAKGRRADKRSDVWAFGCVLFEMLTGQRAFKGDDVADTLAAVLRGEPDWNALPSVVPAPVRKLLRRCLEKDRNRRLADIADGRLEIDELSDAGSVAQPAPAARWIRFAWVPTAIFLLSLLALAAIFLRPAATAPPQTLSVLPPNGASITSLALSPDGRSLAFTATSGGSAMLWVRALGSATPLQLPGTEGAIRPFWSPDSRSIGFFAQAKLKRVAASGGPIQTLADAPGGRGGTWNNDGVILFVPGQHESAYSVLASGGAATKATTVDRSKGEIEHRFPNFLPDGRHFLYTAIGGDAEMNWIRVGTIGSADTVALVQADPNAGVLVRTPTSDYLMFVRQGALLAQRLDVDSLTLRGEPTLVTEERVTQGGSALMPGSISVSASGLIAYLPSPQMQARQLLWVDRSGKPLGAVGGAAFYEHIELSPDKKRLVVDLTDPQSRKRDIWMIDLEAASAARFTFNPDQYNVPRWSPDGTRVVFARVKAPTGIYEKLSNATGTETQTFAAAANAIALPYDWSPDGRFIVFLDWPAGMATKLSVLPLFGDRQVIPVPAGVQAANGRFSPDGRWLAYQSSDSGSPEVWLQPFPPTGAKWQISHEGGSWPRWRPDGKELYFVTRDRTLVGAAIEVGRDLRAGASKRLFPVRYGGLTAQYPYDVSADGQRFLVISPPADENTTSVTILSNWRPTI